MIVLPANPAPNGAIPSLVDRGGVLRGASALRVNRQGDHFKVEISHPPLRSSDEGRIFVARLIRAKSEGLRIPYPLLGVDQSGLGNPVIDGAGQAGRTLAVRGLTVGAVVREGFWFSIPDTTGQHYLYNVGADAVANSTGRATLTITPMLRRPYADGTQVFLGQPMIEGLVEGSEQSWQLSVDHLIGIGYTIEEAG